MFKSAAAKSAVDEARVISLVDIAEHAPSPKVVIDKPPLTNPPDTIVTDDLAENIIETEDDTAKAEAAAMDDAAAQYIKENYTYVQRRILQELMYPNQARRTGIQGVVEVIFTINSNGSASDINVQKSSGKPVLDDEALRAVLRDAPFRRPKTPVRIVMPVSFKLT